MPKRPPRRPSSPSASSRPRAAGPSRPAGRPAARPASASAAPRPERPQRQPHTGKPRPVPAATPGARPRTRTSEDYEREQAARPSRERPWPDVREERGGRERPEGRRPRAGGERAGGERRERGAGERSGRGPGERWERAAGQRDRRPERRPQRARGGTPGNRPPREDVVDAVVLEVYGLVHDQGWLADRALERVLRRERKMWSSERRLAAEAVYGLLRAQGQLDFLLGGAAPGEAARGPGEAGRGVELGMRYAGWLVRSGGATAEDAARRLVVPAAPLRGLAGAETRIAAVKDPVARLAVEGSIPRWIAERFVAELGQEEARQLVGVLNARAPLTVRANALLGDREALRARLQEEGVGAEPTPLSPWGLTLDGHQNAFALKSFQEGWFEIQDEGSQLIALAAGARPNKVVVDACAGAGGKSLALAAEMHNKGTLWALDSDAGRLSEARRRSARAHVDNLRTRPIPAGAEAADAIADLAGQAAVVLVDAPCSGLGTLRRKPDARWRLKPEDPQRFAALQRELLARFAKLLAPGGRLVYATCAMGRTENGDVADWAVKELGLAAAPLAATLGAARAAAAGAAENQLELFPHRHGTDGFFMAAFTRPR
ncbi:MAG: RNA methyltransferase [Anaeromyxobacter sp.]